MAYLDCQRILFSGVGEGVSYHCRNTSLPWSAHLTQATESLVLVAEFQQLHKQVS